MPWLEQIENCLNKNINKGNSLNAWDIVSESLNWFTSLNPQQKEANHIKIMDYFREKFADEQKSCIIEDLKEIAKSDGFVLDAEKKLIKKSAEMLEN